VESDENLPIDLEEAEGITELLGAPANTTLSNEVSADDNLHPPPELSDSDLVQAREVTDDVGQAEFVDLEEAKRRSLQRHRQTWKMLFTLVITVALATAITLGVILSRETTIPMRKPEQPEEIATESPASIASSQITDILDSFRDNLENITIDALADPSSPQSKAMKWLAEHPGIETVDDWRKLQLFALVTFYHSFRGPSWPEKLRDDWLDYKRNECFCWSSGYGTFANNLGMAEMYSTSTSFSEHETLTYSCQEETFVSLDLYDSLNLAGKSVTIPAELGLLTSLESLILAANGINASMSDLFPTYLTSHLTNLQTIQLFSNTYIHGTIPTHIGSLSGLSLELTLFDNEISGELPSELGRLSKLLVLFL
jgi:hypothetical protein